MPNPRVRLTPQEIEAVIAIREGRVSARQVAQSGQEQPQERSVRNGSGFVQRRVRRDPLYFGYDEDLESGLGIPYFGMGDEI